MFRDSVPFTVIGVFALMLVVIWSLEMLFDNGTRGTIKYRCAGSTIVQVSPPSIIHSEAP
jgi:hypothetical protein